MLGRPLWKPRDKCIAILDQKRKKKSAVFFKIIFSHQNPGSGLDPDPDSLESLDPDPQHCLCSAKKGSANGIKFVSLL